MKKIIVMLCCCLCVLSGCSPDADVILQNGSSLPETESGAEEAVVSEEQSGSQEESSNAADSSGEETICVYVCGAVNVPGVYELSADSRVYEAVELAGGLSADADEGRVNLAETMADGEMVQIPTVDEAQSAQTGTDTADGVSDDARININTATAEELTGLNGIGETKAEAIIAYREAHGEFQSADEIMQVDGIGEGTYQKIQDDIRAE